MKQIEAESLQLICPHMFPHPLPRPLSFGVISAEAALVSFTTGPAPRTAAVSFIHGQHRALGSRPRPPLYPVMLGEPEATERGREPMPVCRAHHGPGHLEELSGGFFLFWCFTVCLGHATGISLRARGSCLFPLCLSTLCCNTLPSVSVPLLAVPVAAHS